MPRPSTIAGPSKSTTKPPQKSKNSSPNSSDPSGDEGNPVVIEATNDDEHSVDSVRRQTAVSSKSGKLPTANGATKGKNSRIMRKVAGVPVDIADDDDEETKRLHSELRRLREERDSAESRADQLSHQVLELIRARTKEPEEQLMVYKETAERRMEDMQKIIDEMTSQLAHANHPLLRNGKNSVLQLITREAADEEQNILAREKEKYKRQLDERNKAIEESHKRNSELEREVKSIQAELNEEIKRSKTLAVRDHSRAPGSAQRPTRSVLGNEDPKTSTTIRFYEDLTDLLITNVKFENCKHEGMEDTILSCVYSYKHPDNEDIHHSLTFSLRLCHDVDEAAGIVDAVMYAPRELDREEDDFITALDFLSAPFSFRKEQLQMFLKTLSEQIGKALVPAQGEEDEDEDDDIQMVE